jgi:hypothetical protein
MFRSIAASGSCVAVIAARSPSVIVRPCLSAFDRAGVESVLGSAGLRKLRSREVTRHHLSDVRNALDEDVLGDVHLRPWFDCLGAGCNEATVPEAFERRRYAIECGILVGWKHVLEVID